MQWKKEDTFFSKFGFYWLNIYIFEYYSLDVIMY